MHQYDVSIKLVIAFTRAIRQHRHGRKATLVKDKC